ncbi:MAG: hypothetical protein ABH859_04040 [Pseudomonadota bacterium]
MKKLIFIISLTLIALISLKAQADLLEKNFPAATPSRGLETAAVDLDPATINGYVVVMKEGIPAEQAQFYISWGDYDYRASKVEDGKIKTRRGKIYTFLQPGDIMAVVNTIKFGQRFNIRLISPTPYVPLDRPKDKRHSRVTCSVGFKLPKNEQQGLATIEKWLKPFANYNDAKDYAEGLKRAQKTIYHSL